MSEFPPLSKAEVGYNERDLKLGIAKGAGMTTDECADFAGVSRATVNNRVNGRNKEFVSFIANLVKGAVAASIAAKNAKLKNRYEEMYDQAVDNLKQFLKNPDDRLKFAATTRVIDQIEGKPTQRIENKVTSEHTERLEVVAIPSEAFKFLIASLQGTQKVLTGGQPESVIDVDEIKPADPIIESAAGGE